MYQDYLYHYTNLEALALILKNRTIRLNSLLYMDDSEEVRTKNSDYLGKYCFVSSWTDDQDESIPLWTMYSKSMEGVRIKLKSNPFVKAKLSLPYYDDGNEFESYYPKDLATRHDVYINPAVPFLSRVEYTNDEQLIFPDVFKYIKRNTDGTFTTMANFNDICRYKRECWRFQNEWRYSIIVLPHASDGTLSLDLKPNMEDMPFKNYDLKIREECFEEIEILLGPKMSYGAKVIIECLKEKYCPTAKIKESRLKINI